MNYIQEINDFYDWMETHNSISKNAISLWYALLHVNNKAMWAKTFTTSISTLELKTGIKRSELFKARNELYNCGLIHWRERGSKLSAVYTLYSISHIAAAERAAANAEPIGDDFDEQFGGDPDMEANDDDGPSGDVPELPNMGQIGNPSGNASGNPSGNESGNPNGTETVTISKPNKTKGNKTKPNIDGDKSPLSSGDDATERKKFNKKVLKIFDDYNRVCHNLPRMTTKTDMRKSHVGARLKEHGAANVQKMLKMAAASDFLGGCNDKGWKANFDWLFLPTNFVKVLEGYYAKRSSTGHGAGKFNGGIENYVGKPSHLEIIEQTYQTLLNDGTFDY